MKYKLTDEIIVRKGITLHRIEALNDFSNVKKGDKGGFVESADNLSQNDSAWVSGNALVSGNAVVSGNALVTGNALVSGDAWVYGNALVYDNAQVYGDAVVSGDAWVSGNAVVSGEVQVISIPFLSKYKITVTDNHIKIGCQQHTIEQWRDFEDDEIAVMDDGALEWWEKHKYLIFMAIELRN